ncbi:MAG TPA: MdtA/MuxA family multidrug efflux RND transporter periplasmic adaptor subunit [Terriglobales bacterium]|nr:MdtA/MuxA family multidrug efflux RND transporter periplasmic adaptor subunit [Terriglobales bacterium]
MRSSSRHHPLTSGVSFTAAFLLLLTIAGCNGANSKSAQASSSPPSIPVAVAAAERRDFPVYLSGLGSVQASNTVSLKSRVDGQIVQIAFKEGQFVKQGELLIVIDPRPYQVALEQAEAALGRDQAQLKNAQLDYQRYQGLFKEGVISQQQYDAQRALVGQLEGTIKADQAAIDNAKLQLVYTRVTAPVSGRIGLRLVDIGNMVHASDTNPLLVVTQLQPIAVVFTLPEDVLPNVVKHMKNRTLEVDAYSRDDTTKLAAGKLLTIDNQIDPTTGTGKLKAMFDNIDSALFPNQFVNARLLLETQKGATVVPAAAIQRGPQGSSFAYVVKPDKTVEVRPVKVSLTQGNMSVISFGVAPGEQVVTDGQDKLQSGSHVEPHAPNSAGNSATSGTPGQ